MDEVAVALNIILIFVMMLSISWASFLAWLLFEERWKRERKEKLVESVILPLIEEVGENLYRVGEYEFARDSSGLEYLVSVDEWKRVRYSLLWDAFCPSRVRRLAERVYSEMGDYQDGRWAAVQYFDGIVLGVLKDFMLRKDEALLDLIEVQKVLDMIKSETYRFRNEGFDLYFKEGWDTMKDKLYESVSSFIRKLGSQHSNVCESSVSVEDVFGVVKRRIEREDEIVVFGSMRESILSDGGKLEEELRKWKNEELRKLVGKKWKSEH